MKLYKFYKNNCSGCYAMSRLLSTISIPANITLVELNTDIDENKKFAKDNGVSIVPTLMFEDGRILSGGKVTSKELKEFIGG